MVWTKVAATGNTQLTDSSIIIQSVSGYVSLHYKPILNTVPVMLPLGLLRAPFNLPTNNSNSSIPRYDESKQTSFGVLAYTNPTIATDSGEYYCTAFWTTSTTTQISSNKAFWSLYGIELKPAIGVLDHAATMTCNVNAISDPDAISWYRQGNYLPDQPEKPKYEVRKMQFFV